MAQEQTPLDELTNLPLLCAPHEGVLPVIKGLQENGGLFNWDHVFLPRKHPLLTGSLGGAATRQARIQMLHCQEQHIPKDTTLGGPPLPISPGAQFCTIIPCAAGYIPAQAMDFSSGSLRIITLPDAKRERLRTSGEVCIDLRRNVPNNLTAFAESYVLTQELEGVSPNTVNEFLKIVPDTTARAKRLEELATLMLKN